MSGKLRVAALAELQPGQALTVSRAETGSADDITIFRDDDGACYALDDTCTHAEASLAEGWIADGTVECPLHSAQFCLKTGAALSLPATRATRTHRVEVMDDEIWLLPDTPAGG